jgi:hypothetical protein
MEVGRILNAEEKFNSYALDRLPGFRLVSRSGFIVPSNLSYDFSLEPILGEAVRGIDPSEVCLLDNGEDRVNPFIGFYSLGRESSFNLFGTYLINRTVLPSVLQRLSKDSSYKGRVGGPELRDLFSNRVCGNYGHSFSRENFVFKLMPEVCPIRGVLLEKQQDEFVLAYLRSQGWLGS